MKEIKLENISFTYADKPILQNLSGQIRPGEFLCIAGPSGSGKTTLLRLLAGLEQPGSGSLTADGRNLSRPGRDRAMLFQHDPLFPWMTVEKNVAFSIRCTQAVDKKTALRQARQLLEQVELAGEERKFPCQLSGGMKQRVALARVLGMNSEILLLDEPFGALDPKTRQSMEELLKQVWIKRQMTVVMVTHDLREAVTLADRIWLLWNGRLEAQVELPRSGRDPSALEADLKEQFFGNMEVIP